jgi:twinkle protein
MTAQIKDDKEYYRSQTRFVTRLTEFAKRREVVVHLVAHPRKTGRSEVQADDVAGIGDITNLADNVFRVDRLPDNNGMSADARIRILKNREYGVRGDIPLMFDIKSRRFSDLDNSGFLRKYTWELQEE